MARPEQNFMNKYSDEEIVQSFMNSWNDGDPDDIKSALYAVIKRFGATNISSSTGIPRTTLYDMCKDDSNPTLDNLCKVMDFLRMEESA
jgi:probable addiction module antidote protein